jgi:catechol 2,3-dioxygenase-like lactoylglutathione lyase family enzyme
MDMKLEVLLLPVSDVDRTKRFYEKLGFRLDLDVANEDSGEYNSLLSQLVGLDHLR